MVHEVFGVGGGESGEYLHGHEPSGLVGEEYLGPAGAASRIDGNLVAGLDSGGFPHQDVGLYLFGELAVGGAGFPEVTDCGLIPALLYAVLEPEEEIVVFCKNVHLGNVWLHYYYLSLCIHEPPDAALGGLRERFEADFVAAHM